jgi:hypothetical protein
MFIDEMKKIENMKVKIHMITLDFMYVNNLAKWVYFLYIMVVHASN